VTAWAPGARVVIYDSTGLDTGAEFKLTNPVTGTSEPPAEAGLTHNFIGRTRIRWERVRCLMARRDTPKRAPNPFCCLGLVRK
jgi:hypothetical protein